MVLGATLALLLAGPAAHASTEPARLSLDFKDADAADVLRLMAEVGGFQVVVDSGVSCRLTLKLAQVELEPALDVLLRACGLGREEAGGILRVAPAARLLAEAVERRRLGEERRLSGPLRTIRFRLSYARAQDLAPLLARHLSPRGRVTFDARTNTLYVTDVDGGAALER